MKERKKWISLLTKMAFPVVTAIAEEKFYRSVPLETIMPGREAYAALEILGRTLAGLAPWLECPCTDEEEVLRSQYAELSRKAIAVAVDPHSPDYAFNGPEDKNWNMQWLVDAGFLALAIVRAPKELGQKLPPKTKEQLVQGLLKTRNYRPVFNNWLLFSGMVEGALYVLGADYDLVRVDYALRQTEQWYVGDGVYGDGASFKMDYYNSFVIQPMLLHLVKLFHHRYQENEIGTKMYKVTQERFRRYAKIQEAIIAPDGSYPPIGRSLTYRCGAFQVLAQAAWMDLLPEEVTPAMARQALSRVIYKTLEAPETFSQDGFLQIGICGHQRNLGAGYITTASLYMATMAFLPLGLPQDAHFWTDPEELSTWEKHFSGVDVSADFSLLDQSWL